MDAIAQELGLPISGVVPVALVPDREAYNVDALQLRISESLPAARHAQLSRAHAGDHRGGWWGEIRRLYHGVRTIIAD
jgi:hypothetical protein